MQLCSPSKFKKTLEAEQLPRKISGNATNKEKTNANNQQKK